MVPRLLAVAPPGWQHRLAQFRRELEVFARQAAPLGDRAAVYLRAHDASPRQWQDWLEALDLGAMALLRLGISLPLAGVTAQPLAGSLAALGVHFVHLPAAAPFAPWLREPRPFALARAIHAPLASTDRHPDEPVLDWHVLSPILPTASKPGVAPLGLEALRRHVRASCTATVALGGVDAESAARVLATGVAGVACLRAAWNEGDRLVAACVR